MEILKRVVKDGQVVGVELDMDGYICPFPTKGLYNEQILVALVDAGYKYYNYQGDIELPSGKHIDDLEMKDIILYNSDEIAGFEGMLITAEMEALTDAEASQYYSYRTNMQRVELRKESSYEINTREEFEQYIMRQQIMIASYGYSSDNRPINSFVNPSALYTMEELVADDAGKIYSKLNILAQRRRFRDYNSYLHVVKYLNDKGLLNSMSPSIAEFMQAYYAWGPDGLTGDCINLKFKQGVDGDFKSPDDILPPSGDKAAYVVANRQRVPFILDNDANLRHLQAKVSLNGILQVDEFGRQPLAITTDSSFIEVKRRDNKGFKYSLGYANKSKVSDRVYFTYLVDGYKYIYKTSPNEIAIFLAANKSPRWTSSVGFSVATLMGNIDIELENVTSQDSYILWNICINNAAIHVKNRTTPSPVSSTYEMLMGIGMTPISAVRYMAYHAIHDPNYDSNRRIKDLYEGLSTECVDKYYQPIPDVVLEAFMLTEEDVAGGARAFIDVADIDNLMDRREQQLNQIILPGMVGYDPTFTKGQEKENQSKLSELDAVHFYNNMKFVADCIDGLVSIDAFGDGQIKDAGSATKIAAEVLMSIVYAELGDTPDIAKAADILNNLDNDKILNTSNLFKKRDNAYKGYLVDYSRARKCKANAVNTWAWAYVSKVFRELGNKPIEETRPYLLELIMIQNDKKGMIYRNAIIEYVKAAVDASDMFPKTPIIEDSKHPDYGLTYYDAAERMFDDVASKLFFTILGKKGYVEDGDDYVYTIKFDLEHSLDVRIPKQIATICQAITNDKANHVRYITVFDVCEREFAPNAAGGSFALHIVNADITPWSVAPRKGFRINTYNLLPSYYRTQALVDKFGSAWYESATASKAISNTPLVSVLPALEVPTYTQEEQYILNQELKAMDDYDSFDSCLYMGNTEQVANYVKRWSAACKIAKAQGKIVEHMPLKQDIVYQNLTDILTGESVQDELRFKYGENTALSSIETSVLRHGMTDMLALTTRNNEFSLSYVYPGDITTEQFADIYIRLVHPGKKVAISGNWIVNLGENICVPTMTRDNPTVQKLFNEYAVQYGKDYYVVSVKGIYKIGAQV